MRYPLRILLVVLVCSTALMGCSAGKQLNKVSFITAIGIDKGALGVTIHTLIAIPGNFPALSPGGGGGNGKQSPNYILSEEGTNVADALFKIKRKTAQNLNFGHTKIILFSDELCKEGIAPYLDLFMRSEEFQINSWIAITKGSTKDILLAKPEVPQSVSDYLVDIFSRTGSDSLEILPIYLFQFYSYLHEPGKTPYAMIVSTQKEGNGLQLTDLELFRMGKKVGTISPRETKYLRMLNGRRLKSVSLNMMKKSYNVLGFHTKNRINGEVINVDMNLRLEVSDNPSATPISYPEIRELESTTANSLQKDIEDLIKKLQKLKADPVGFGEKYRIAHGGDLQADEWIEHIFPMMAVRVKVTVKIVRKGMLT